MLTILIALALLAAGVGAIYLLLKNMTEEGIDIAAPGSCRRGQCGVKCRPTAEAKTVQTADTGDQTKVNS